MRVLKNWKVFESTESVEEICQKYDIRNWKLNPDGTVDVDGNVNLYDRGLKELPLKFGRVTGNFDCSWNKLTSLEGSPNWVGGYFDCRINNLTSLVGSPNWVGGNFRCNWNRLTNLEGCPERVYGDLYCQNNEIHSLEYYPPILTGRLFTSDNPIFEIWKHVIDNKDKNHGILLELFWLNNPIRFEGGEWVCYREFLDNFLQEIGVTSPNKLKYYKEV